MPDFGFPRVSVRSAHVPAEAMGGGNYIHIIINALHRWQFLKQLVHYSVYVLLGGCTEHNNLINCQSTRQQVSLTRHVLIVDIQDGVIVATRYSFF